MALQSVPWAVGGGAVHSPDVARAAIYASSGGVEGVAEPWDFAVKALDVPAGQVRVHIGSALINMYNARQSYTVRSLSDTLVDIAPNSGSSTRWDMVVIRVEDPFSSGSPWQEPSNPAVGPYVHVRVIPNVFSYRTSLRDLVGHTTDSGIALARIAVPPSTATITDAMITDLRVIAMPRRSESVFARPRVFADDTAGLDLVRSNANGGEYFPGGNGSPNVARIDVPEWATSATIDADWMSLIYWPGEAPYGMYWIEFGDEYRAWTWPENRQLEFRTEKFAFNAENSSDKRRANWRLMDRVYMPAKLRGKTVFFSFTAGLTSTGHRGPSLDYQGGLGLRVLFEQQPEIDA